MSLSVDIKNSIRNSFKDTLKERRSRIDIIADILSVAGEEAKKTRIVYSANLNFARADEYLQYLVDKGLIENSSREYKTTEKGGRIFAYLPGDVGTAKVTEDSNATIRIYQRSNKGEL